MQEDQVQTMMVLLDRCAKATLVASNNAFSVLPELAVHILGGLQLDLKLRRLSRREKRGFAPPERAIPYTCIYTCTYAYNMKRRAEAEQNDLYQ